MDPLIPSDPPSTQPLVDSVEAFLAKIETKDVSAISQSFDQRIQSKYSSKGRESRQSA